MIHNEQTYVRLAMESDSTLVMKDRSCGRAGILLVADDPGDVQLFREALAARDVPSQLEVAGDGEVAMLMLRGQPPFEDYQRPDLVILDLVLSGNGGREMLAAMKADPQLRLIPVVVFTTSDDPSDVNGAYNLHANCTIRRPSSTSEYLDVIGRCETFWLNIASLPNR